jgi:hypothetical protein
MEELKFTVTFPTLWRSEYIEDMLHRYSECPQVEEVILIDNAPELNKEVKIDKVIHIREKVNTYAIPPVNKGVELAKCDNVIISSDDIKFDVDEYCNLLTRINQSHKLETLGYIGSHSHNYEITKLEDVKFNLYDPRENITGWGCLVTVNKKLWTPLPSQLKIWYADNWLQAVHQGRIYQLKGIPIETKMSTTSNSPEFQKIIDQDTIEWHKLIRNGYKT